jgi:hypothetical protein
VIALQLLAGPLVAHELTRPLAALVGFQSSREDVVDQVVEFWLRAMAPEASGSAGQQLGVEVDVESIRPSHC